jgi:two-component system response regulator FixJ
MRPTVFLVDDDNAYRRSLRFLLEAADLAVEDFVSAPDFLDAYDPQRPGCLLLDVRMPQMSGLELQEQLRRRQLSLPIIFITGHGNVPMSVKAMKGGAMDFIEKPFDGQMLVDRIKQAFLQDAKQRQHRARVEEIGRLCARLTGREREVMELVVAGQTNKQIAASLNLSHRTVEVHRARIMDKMECESLSELLGLAVECGMLVTD